ncbi:MAG: PTS sugar transporter subunit IIA [Verrucomicrobia bacterium]|nr:PTS sugar transporter subunit IIA [Verrucomicrobiota bacterium]
MSVDNISKYFNEKLVIFLEGTTRDEVLRELVDQATKAKKVKEPDLFFKAVLDREKLVSTGIGMGVAIPHAKLPTFNDFFLVIGIKHGEGIAWDAPDGAPVRLVFLIGGPDNRQTDYLQLLSRLTTALKNPERRKKALLVESAKEVVNLFKSS